MLYTSTTPEQKRKLLRQMLASGQTLQFPGAFNPLSARLIEDKGFDGVYISGAVIAADLGLPDIGLTTLSEVAARAQQISRMTNLPTLVDADTGFGEPLNLARTVQTLEDSGVSAIHIEDQVNPKRCGHLDGKSVVDEETAIKRVASAVRARRDQGLVIIARTDIRGVASLDETILRIRALVAAGADAIFPEALLGLEEFAAVREAIDVPILVNMTEFGKGELFQLTQLQAVGANIVIHPVSLLRVAMGAAERALDSLRADGSLVNEVPRMQTRSRLYELINYESYNSFDSGVYDFTLQPDQ
jgi:methylisocitrate lyase